MTPNDEKRYLNSLDASVLPVLAEVHEASAIAERDAIIAADDEALCELWRERCTLQMRVEHLERVNRSYRIRALIGLAALMAAVVTR